MRSHNRGHAPVPLTGKDLELKAFKKRTSLVSNHPSVYNQFLATCLSVCLTEKQFHFYSEKTPLLSKYQIPGFLPSGIL